MSASPITAAVVLRSAGLACGQNCAGTSVAETPLNDLGTGLYLGQFQGGLYPGGSNSPPAAHSAEGLARAGAVEPPPGVVLAGVGRALRPLELHGARRTGARHGPPSPRDRQRRLRRTLDQFLGSARSEERRVGKECRSRWSP